MSNRKPLVCTALVFICLSVFGQAQTTPRYAPTSLSLSLLPKFSFPLGRATELFSYGGGVEFSAAYGLPFLPRVYAGASLGYSLMPIKAATSLSLLSGGLDAGVHFDIGDRIDVRGSGTVGYFYGVLNDGSRRGGANPFVSGGVNASYLISPKFSAGMGASFRSFFGLCNDLAVNLMASYGLPIAVKRSTRPSADEKPLPGKPAPLKEKPAEKPPKLPLGTGLEITQLEFSNVFPVFYKFYNDHPIGRAKVSNVGKTSATDIKIAFMVKQYMDNPKLCAALEFIEPGEEREVDISGLFKSTIMEISEPTLVSTNITIDYIQAGKAQKKEVAKEIRIYDRNAMTWDDDRKAAAFVTAKDPTVLKFSKNVTSMLKGKASSAVNAKLLSAMGIHEALCQYGLNYVVDPTTPHKEISQNKQAVDFLQFPVQTLEYKAGDCDDLSILYCALLESVGVETAFITIPGHIYMAFCLDVRPDEARKNFQRPDDLIYIQNKVWIPIEVTQRTGGFLKAWEIGAKEWRENQARNQTAFYPTHECWARFEAVGFSGTAVPIIIPAESQIEKAYTAEVTAFVDREIYPRVAVLQAEIKKSQDSTRAVNSLGVLYAQYGLYDRAEREFQKLVHKDYVPALINMGNILLNRSSMREALGYFQRAYEKEPDNPRVLLCIARTNHELENYGEAKVAYNTLKALDPELANRFAYLDLRGEEAARAAEISQAKEVVIWEEGK
jgi:hypothetical protein